MSLASTTEPRVEQTLFQPLRRLRRRARVYLAVEGALEVFFVAVCALLAHLSLDWFFRLSLDQRLVFGGAAALLVLWVFYRSFVRRVVLRLSDAELAAVVDRANPELRDGLATAVQFARGDVGDAVGNSPELVRETIRGACESAGRVSFMAVLNHRRARRKMTTLVSAVAAVVLAGCVRSDLVSTWFQRNCLWRDTPWAQDTYIRPDGLIDGRLLHPRGEPLEIAATIEGAAPRSAELRWRSGDGKSGRQLMSRKGRDTLRATLGDVSEPLTFEIVGGDEHTPRYHVDIVDRPQITALRAEITPPDYARLAPIVVEQQTSLDVLRGATLAIEARVSKAVRTAHLIAADGTTTPCELTGSDAVRVFWPEPRTGAFEFDIVGEHGFGCARPVRLTVTVVEDKPPDVRLHLAAVGEYATPQATVDVEVECEDTYGVQTARLYVQRGDETPLVAELNDVGAGSLHGRAAFEAALAELEAQPGDSVRFWAEATDFNPLAERPGESNRVVVRVLSRDEFLNECNRRELELRRELEQILSGQRGVAEGVERLQRGGGDAEQQAAALARQQVWSASKCASLAGGVDRLLAEMRASRAVRPADEHRLADLIIAPLRRLAEESMPKAAEMIEDATADQMGGVVAEQGRLTRELEAILSNFRKWEGFEEALKLLEQVVEQQRSVRDQTEQTLSGELSDLLDLLEDDEQAEDGDGR